MIKSLLLIGSFSFTLSSTAQEYELIATSKEKELLTTATMDTILSKVEQLQHPTEVVYYQLSVYTTIKILPSIKEIKNEQE